MFLVFALPFLTAECPENPPDETPVSPRLSADVDHQWFSRNVSGWRHKSFWTQHYLQREFRNQWIEEFDLYLKMRFLSYDYEILFSSWSITQGTIIRKKIIFLWQLAYVLIYLNLYKTIHYKFTCVYKKYPSLPVLWHVIDELEMMEGVSDSLHDLFWHVIHPLDVRMSDPAITWRSIMTDNK